MNFNELLKKEQEYLHQKALWILLIGSLAYFLGTISIWKFVAFELILFRRLIVALVIFLMWILVKYFKRFENYSEHFVTLAIFLVNFDYIGTLVLLPYVDYRMLGFLAIVCASAVSLSNLMMVRLYVVFGVIMSGIYAFEFWHNANDSIFMAIATTACLIIIYAVHPSRQSKYFQMIEQLKDVDVFSSHLNSNTLMMILDSAGKIKEVNANFLSKTGFEKDYLIGKNYSDVFVHDVKWNQLKTVMKYDNVQCLSERAFQGQLIVFPIKNGWEFGVLIFEA